MSRESRCEKEEKVKRRLLVQLAAGLLILGGVGLPPLALAADEAADAMIKRLSNEVLAAIKADKAIKAGDLTRIMALVDSKIMPNVNFQRMTAAAVGPGLAPGHARAAESACRTSTRSCWCAPTRVPCSRSTTWPSSPQAHACRARGQGCRGAHRGQGQAGHRAGATRLPAGKDPGCRPGLEDLQPQRHGRLAGPDLPQPVCPGSQCQGHRRPDQLAGRAQQGQRRAKKG